jgi:hypothetical protein
VIGTVHEAGLGAPKRWGKHNHRQEKEDAGDLKPQDAAHPAEGAKKTADATGNTARYLPGSLTGGPALSGSSSSLGGARGLGGSFRASGHALAGNPPGDPQPDPQGSANGVRFHTVYDGSSDPCRTGFQGRLPFRCCSQPATEVRYRNPTPQPAPFHRADCRSRRYP